MSEPLQQPNSIGPPPPSEAARQSGCASNCATNLPLRPRTTGAFRWALLGGFVAIVVTSLVTMQATSSFCLARLTSAKDQSREVAFENRRDEWELDPRGFEIFQSMEPKGLADSCGWTLTNLRSDPLVIQGFRIEGAWDCPIALHNPGIEWRATTAIHLPLTLGIGESVGFLQYTPTDATNSYSMPVKTIKVETSRGTFYFDSVGKPL